MTWRALAVAAIVTLAIVTSCAVSEPLAMAEPAVQLTGYQKRWIQDKARFKTGRMARQTGKSFGTTLEIALEMAETPRTPEVILSSGQRASKENIDKVAMHLRAIHLAAEVLTSEWAGQEGKYTAHEIVAPNGSRVIGLPANPDTARGHSANVYLDEFAFHKESRKIWAALFPTITRGYRLRVTSTPQGKQNKFYELDTNPAYSHHVVTIVDAIADGLELRDPETGELVTPEELRAALGDDEAYEQEYMVAFLDEATAWLSYELISAAEDHALDLVPDWIEDLIALAVAAHQTAPTIIEPLPFTFPAPPGELDLGLDVGRRRDLTVIWLNARRAELRETWAAIELRKQPFGVQERVLYTLMKLLPVRRACIDETGIGAQLAERAQDRFGEHVVEPITFSSANKAVLAVQLKQQLQDRLFRIPIDRRVRESFHSLKRIETATGNFRFDADRTEATGHADHAWAAALALQAGDLPAAKIEFRSAGGSRVSTGPSVARFAGARRW